MRWAGLIAGLLVSLALLGVSRVEGGPDAVGADLTVTAAGPGELVVERARPVLAARGLRENGPAARARVSVRNVSPHPLRITARLLMATDDLDGGVRTSVGGPLRLRPGQGGVIPLTARVIPGGDAVVAGRAGTATLELRAAR